MKLNFIWKRKEGMYQSGDNLYVNKILVGYYEYNGTRSRDAIDREPDWKGSINLPSLSDKASRQLDNDLDKLRAKMEWVVTNWATELLKEGE